MASRLPLCPSLCLRPSVHPPLSDPLSLSGSGCVDSMCRACFLSASPPSLCLSLLLLDIGWSLSSKLTLPPAPPSGSPVRPELPRAPAPALFGARSPAVQIFGRLQGIPGQQGGWAGWRGVFPAPGGPRHVMSCPSPQLGLRLHVPPSGLAAGRGLLLAPVPSRAKRFQLQPLRGQPERGGSRAGWAGRPRCLG